jgi:tetratricopeptide (TPR) repeat protein
MLAFGEKLRSTFYENLTEYVDDLDLIDHKELYPFHADFLSRLGMTFSHGDYAQIDQIKDATGIAEKLYQKSLAYAPDHRAYLGLGILGQKKRQYEDSIAILEKGLEHFPQSEHLHTCLGLSYMNLGDYRTALRHFPKNSNSEEIRSYIEICREALKRNK